MNLQARLLLLVGTVAVVSLAGVLYLYSPSPGGLANPHGVLRGTESQADCRVCHRPEGLEAGCLACHEEIDDQHRSGHGLHAQFLRDGETRCGACHEEHHGDRFELVNSASWRGEDPADFDHGHVDFPLHGAHDELACEKCHVEQLAQPFALASFPEQPRAQTFLGLDPACRRCHDDPHAKGLVRSCEECHDQSAFADRHFDHSEHLPLVGAHAEVECATCHRFPEPGTPSRPHPFPFDNAPPAVCSSCHESPHRVDFGESCQECHAVDEAIWTTARANMDPSRHAHTGFALEDPHAKLECSACHDPALDFAVRHPDPHDAAVARTTDTCEKCHQDPHGGQFLGSHAACLDCHQRTTFHPTRIDRDVHGRHFPLTGAHRAASCAGCHVVPAGTEVRSFVGTPHSCKECHADQHAGQFADQLRAGDCTKCHAADCSTFRIRPFDHEVRTGHRLEGAHAGARCEQCHLRETFEVEGHAQEARRYPHTPTECADCHRDVHRGQLSHHESCTACHRSFTDWTDDVFDHDTQSRFPLDGAHRGADCARCHRPILQEDGVAVVQYRPLGRQCKDCHEIDQGPLHR